MHLQAIIPLPAERRDQGRMNVDDLHRKRPDHSFRNRDQKTRENDQIGRKLLQFPKECLIEPFPRLIIFRGKAQRRYTGILRARQRVRTGAFLPPSLRCGRLSVRQAEFPFGCRPLCCRRLRSVPLHPRSRFRRQHKPSRLLLPRRPAPSAYRQDQSQGRVRFPC